MNEKHIIRSPSFSDSRVVLKSGNDAFDEVVSKAVAQDVIQKDEREKPPIDKEDFHEKYNEYNNKLNLLNEERAKLADQLAELEKKELELENEKNSFKDALRKEIEVSMEEKIRQKYKERNNELLNLIDDLYECKSRELLDFEEDLIVLVYEAVCKILGKSAIDKVMVISMVQEVISQAQDRMQMTLNVSHQDYGIIENAKAELSRGLNNRLDIISDDQVKYGGCILKTEAGAIDGRLEQQLSRFRDLLLEERMRIVQSEK